MKEEDKKILQKMKDVPFATLKGVSEDIKSRFYVALYNKGMTNGTINRRIMLVGFKEWERIGIDQTIMDFAEKKGLEGELNTSNILSVLMQKRGLREQFYSYMTNRGMSRITCIKRFEPTQPWLPWERMGIKRIVEQIESENNWKK